MLTSLRSKLVHNYRKFRSYIGRPRIVVQTQPIILSDSELCHNPIFLIGIHRSGTSLCRRILDSHSQIASPPETYFLEHFASMIRDQNTFAGFEGMGFDHLTVLNEIRNWAARYHEAYRKARGKLRWADKTPQYIAILPEIEQLFGPKSQYIMIFRHPLDVVYSIFKRGWKFSNYNSDPLINVAMYVSQNVQKQLLFAKKYPNRCFFLHYESLIDNPETTLKAMFQFLGEKWEPNVLNYNSFSHGFGTEDPVVRGTTGFIPNFGNWKALSQQQITKILPIVEEVMAELRYSLNNSD